MPSELPVSYSMGLLRGSYIPDRGQRELRELMRYRTAQVRERARELKPPGESARRGETSSWVPWSVEWQAARRGRYWKRWWRGRPAPAPIEQVNDTHHYIPILLSLVRGREWYLRLLPPDGMARSTLLRS